METLSVQAQLELTLRLVAALLLGAVIGWERELQRSARRSSPSSVRTP
jgi:uncharacterized membrane protein YhiD involved in acid resistance